MAVVDSVSREMMTALDSCSPIGVGDMLRGKDELGVRGNASYRDARE